MPVKQLLHAGCGSKVNKPPREFAAFREVRLDCNRGVAPDILASIVAMPMIADQSYDAVYCSHCLEHLNAYEVSMALAEFARVLKPGGELLVQVPDLQSIGGKLALDQADLMIYQSLIGPITPLDMLYGHRGSVGAGNQFMQHKSGFTSSVLRVSLDGAGFEGIEVTRENQFELFGRAFKPEEIHEQEEGRDAGRLPGGAGDGHREVPERAFWKTGLPAAAG